MNDTIPGQTGSPDQPRPPGRGQAAALRRRERSEEILRATRSLFDAAGVRDAQIEDIARAVGINRAIIYRHFSGKEELFALTLVTYLDELRDRLSGIDDATLTPAERLKLIAGEFIDYGREFPAFTDCALTLLRTPGSELMADMSESALFRLGRSMGSCLAALVHVLEAGNETGDFAISNPNLMANVLYTQTLGGLQLTRLQLVISESTPGLPEVSGVSFEEVRSYLQQAAVAMAVGARGL